MLLPPPGSPDDKIVQYCDGLVHQSRNDLRRSYFEDECDRALALKRGDHFKNRAKTNEDGRVQYVINRIKKVVYSIMVNQAGDVPEIKFTPRETGEPPTTFQKDPMTGALVQIDPMMAMQQKQVAMASGLPPPPFIEASDANMCKALKVVWDGMWEMDENWMGGQWTFQENVDLKCTYGVSSTHFQFNRHMKRMFLTNVPELHVFRHPTVADPMQNPYSVYDEHMSAEEAQQEYPQLTPNDLRQFNEGQPHIPGGAQYSRSQMFNQQFRQDTGFVRHVWIRGYPYPMRTERAIQRGVLKKGPVPTGRTQPTVDPTTGMPLADEFGAPVQEQVMRPGLLTPGGTPIEPPADSAFNGFFSPPASSATALPNWPTETGIRQITIVGTRVIADERCPYNIIPLRPNVHYRVDHSPLGQGDPVDLEDLQMGLNRLFSDLMSWAHYNAVPPEFILKEVLDRLEPIFRKARTKWNQRIPISISDLPEGYKMADIVHHPEPPKMPPEFWKLIDFIMQMIDKQGNQADVAQGNAAPGWSGEAINSLQNAHNLQVQSTGLNTVHWLKSIVQLWLQCVCDFMEPEDLHKYCSEYPPEIWVIFKQKIKALNFDFSVKIKSGSAASEQAETQSMVAARQAGIMVPESELLKRVGVDPKQAIQDTAEFERAKLAAGLAPPSNGDGKENGNGKSDE